MSVKLVNIFGITSTRLLECLDVLNISEVVEAQECMCNLKIVLHYFQKTLGFQKSTGVPGGPKQLSENVLRIFKKSLKLINIFV